MQAKNILTSHRCGWIFPALAILLGGCASGLSKDECHLADWRALGYEDGVQGWSEAKIGEHRKACAKHGVALNLDAYHVGWEEGVSRYCQPGNGYNKGRAGQRYAGVCPDYLEPEFLHAYQHGKELYDLETGLRQTERKLRHKRNRLANIEVEIRDAGIKLVKNGATTEQRVVLLDDLRKLEREYSETKSQIPVLETERERQAQQLAAAKTEQQY